MSSALNELAIDYITECSKNDIGYNTYLANIFFEELYN